MVLTSASHLLAGVGKFIVSHTGKIESCCEPRFQSYGIDDTKYIALVKVPFWSTKDKGSEPFTFKIGLGQVIKAVS